MKVLFLSVAAAFLLVSCGELPFEKAKEEESEDECACECDSCTCYEDGSCICENCTCCEGDGKSPGEHDGDSGCDGGACKP